MLTVALPKGRIAQETLEIFETLFGDGFAFDDRKLILETPKFRFLLVRNQDVATYVFHQAADIGVVGLDTLEEQGLDVIRLLDLKRGICKVAIGMKKGEKFDLNKPEIKVASKMVNITKRYFEERAVSVDIIKLYGSIELAPLIGLADMIVDVVETGSTMKQNGLEVVEDIMTSSTYLIANKNSYIAKKDEVLDIYEKIKSVIDAEQKIK
ncbi:ATP phosphoribosyltransferase (homohexameric) [Sulfurimonas denitrificans DSM 1251]|jgi:ATP phosphoribosyltransferase|uniref:ATP phosphoribosyltransferase n=1 Tax=Sulfurimonas denitrificans (strain ATCC 33889 / DSM 1251) TaxID=326298 RepID=HIS1_SULDN|nr:ATP phosphoribosyltransferase [Sulfurimonas denitrificans]Q30S64.1 RecName: Full=ATP phosphoribosyltransferase; Short=ATP-PRT; Short=ATP-PRTase [Sulfurimonas denitrificans DSM 1251]ABB44167.1 ATP phosphoribosyltransferase (homohexameric) [Sulfurimonas denitrificans DSM 1251]MDD3441824.1 ATP phosphoribosyltransferase [Sulfurimonas denitrificans]